MRERHAWIAVTAVLGTSLLWLSSVSLVLLFNAYATRFPEVVAVARAVIRTALHLGQVGGPTALAALGAAGALLAVALRPAIRAGRRTSHD